MISELARINPSELLAPVKKQKPDEYVKTVYNDLKDFYMEDSEIADIISQYRLSTVLNDLIKIGNYANQEFSIVITNTKNQDTGVIFGFYDFDKLEMEHYACSYDKFLNILAQVKNKYAEKYPNSKEEYLQLYDSILEKIKNITKN